MDSGLLAPLGPGIDEKQMASPVLENDLAAAIRSIPDYPKPGIIFRDITTLLGNARAFRRAVDELVQPWAGARSEEHTSELQSLRHLVCRLLLEKKNKIK